MKQRIRKSLVMLTAVLALGFAVRSAQAQDLKPEQFGKAMDAYLEKDENVEKVGNALRKYFMKKEQEARSAAEKAEKDKIEDQFKNPVKIDLAGSPVKGPKDAKVTIVEFSEFQCPYCRRGASTMDEILKAYPENVNYVFKHYPLPFHPQAIPAAKASIAAQKQGKFWEMHDKLFANQQALGDELYMNLAKELGLDLAKFKADMEDPKTAKMIEDDRAQGEKLGVRGTPGYFVNGVNISGAQPLANFKPIIDRWLQQQAK